MLPNFNLISEIELFSVGFKNAKMLATKLVTAFRLCSELLSNQSHYDFSMRTMKSVLRLSKSRKTECLDENEETILCRAINAVNRSKLAHDDMLVFQVILCPIQSNQKSGDLS